MRRRDRSGTLHIASLSGELRGRPIAGEGDIEFAAPSTLAGDLRVRLGQEPHHGERIERDRNQVDATVELAVASLNDWVPDTRGSLTGRFTVRGVWPKLTIAGSRRRQVARHGRERHREAARRCDGGEPARSGRQGPTRWRRR